VVGKQHYKQHKPFIETLSFLHWGWFVDKQMQGIQTDGVIRFRIFCAYELFTFWWQRKFIIINQTYSVWKAHCYNICIQHLNILFPLELQTVLPFKDVQLKDPMLRSKVFRLHLFPYHQSNYFTVLSPFKLNWSNLRIRTTFPQYVQHIHDLSQAKQFNSNKSHVGTASYELCFAPTATTTFSPPLPKMMASWNPCAQWGGGKRRPRLASM